MKTLETTAVSRLTFPVDDVKLGNFVLPVQKMKESVETVIGSKVEACDNYIADVVKHPGYNSLIAAVHMAYDEHLPLTLSPDMIWLTIAQGLAKHIANNAEELRHHFVKHEGKVQIDVQRDDFIRFSPENPWAEVWPKFSEKIRGFIGDESHALISSNFSTTGTVEMAASEITLMDCVESYFSYQFSTLCGIPEVTLEGTKDDWENILQKIDGIEKYGLEWWTPVLRTIVGEFVNAFDGNVNTPHWRQIYKLEGGSGGPYINGWIGRLFPYMKKVHRSYSHRVANYTTRNPLMNLSWMNPSPFAGLKDDVFPDAQSSVPFVWDYRGTKFDYEFVGGILAIEQNSGIRPRIGWAVREKVGLT